MVTATNGLKIVPDYSISHAPHFDLIVIPGGMGTRKEVGNEALLRWIGERNEQVSWMTSVCTGAFLLAQIGLLDGKSATTHWLSIDRLRAQYPEITVRDGVKFVDEDKIVTSAGISAGIHMAFHMVERLLGKQAALNTAKIMEFDLEL